MAAKFHMPIKRGPKSDPQQYRLYRMENEAIGGRKADTVTKERLKRFLHSLCRMYRVPRVRVVFKDLGVWGAEYDIDAGPHGTIAINFHKKKSCADKLTSAHEFAHHLMAQFDPDSTHQSHGPEFMCAYMHVLDQMRYVPIVGMRAICKQYGLAFKNPGVGSTLSALARQCRPR